jgi:hypothetical protein
LARSGEDPRSTQILLGNTITIAIAIPIPMPVLTSVQRRKPNLKNLNPGRLKAPRPIIRRNPIPDIEKHMIPHIINLLAPGRKDRNLIVVAREGLALCDGQSIY